MSCDQNHPHHPTLTTAVKLGVPHLFHDYPPIPKRFEMAFLLDVFDDKLDRRRGYCPAFGSPGQTIRTHSIWEPPETLALLLCSERWPNHLFFDFGANVGYYSVMMGLRGHDVIAYDGDEDILRVLKRNMGRVGQTVTGWIASDQWIDEGFSINPFHGVGAIAKMDIEGSERYAVDAMMPYIDQVDAILIEMSPVFNDSYPDIARDIMAAGFIAAYMPDKEKPPKPRDTLEEFETEHDPDFVVKYVNSYQQSNILFYRS